MPHKGSEALVGPPPKLPETANRAAANRYKTPARQLGPPPDGRWAASTLRQIAAEASREGRGGAEEASSSDGDEDIEQLERLPGSVQQVYATLIPRTASKMLARSHNRRTQSTRSRKSLAEVPSSSGDEPAAGGAFASTARASDDPPPDRSSSSPANAPVPTHHFAGSRSVSKLSAKAKSQYLRRTATGRRIPLDMEDFVAQVNQPLEISSDDDEEGGGNEASYEGDSDDSYDPDQPLKLDVKKQKGKKRPRKWVDTPATGAVKRLKVGAAARGNFLNQVKETGFSPLLAKTPTSAPSRMRSISVIEKSIDRSTVKKRTQRTHEKERGRRVKSLALVPAEEAGAVADVPDSPALEFHAPNGVMPDDLPAPPPTKAPPMRKKPAQQRMGTKSRFRYIPARLPAPQRLASVRAAQAATKENLGGPATEAQLEKADPANKGQASERRFRFATGPGAKRAPTVLYDLPSSLLAESDVEGRRSPDSPIRSDHSAAQLVHSDVEPCDDAAQVEVMYGTVEELAPQAATSGPAQPIADDVPAAGASHDLVAAQHSAARRRLNGQAIDQEPVIFAPPTSQEQPQHGVALNDDQARVSLPSVVLDSQGGPSIELSLPAPAGKRMLLPSHSFAGRDSDAPISPELRAETSSSASSGIWSRLPSQFDRRFGTVAASEVSTAQHVEVPSTASLLEAAYADADEPSYHTHFPRIGRVGHSLPASFEL